MFLSALVVAHNEESRLAACLSRLGFCDEIVVVLDRCTDASRDIAARFTPRLIEGAWEREGPRRHAGIDACQGPWILEVDADEHIPDALASEIRALIASKPEADRFLIPVNNYVGRRLVKDGWGGSFGVRNDWALFRKGCKVWHDQRVHPQVTLKGKSGPRLKHGYAHYVDDNISDMLLRLNRYTSAKALDMLDTGISYKLLPNMRRFFTRFFQCYVRRRGYREGIYGLTIALCAGLFPLVSYIKYQELKDQNHAPPPKKPT
jgi:glycosyltransferase involved in cell wall biosynthesis